MLVNEKSIKKAIHELITDEEIKIIERVVGTSIYNLINDRLLMVGVVSIDVIKVDSYVDPDFGKSLSEHIKDKFGEDAINVIKKIVGACYSL